MPHCFNVILVITGQAELSMASCMPYMFLAVLPRKNLPLYLLLSTTADNKSSVAFKKNRQNMSLTTIMNEKDFVGICSMNSFGDVAHWQRIVVVQ